ncbi:hypothetical protein [Cellvibrio sp. NN19]|uniref:hypothetical protein n=1 Tax=Cellvibrio chitinivorans TaxID=3102792 RepID=UPI002B40912E|nr:hypothetical protein [Cellvibrio sp. NN19]
MTFNYADLTPQHFVASINWIWKMSAPSKWNLTPEEIAILIGMNVREYLEIQKMANEDQSFLLQPDVAERLSLLLGIWKRLQLMGFSDDTAIAVFNRKNNGELLNGKSIKSFLLESSSLAEYYAVNSYLEMKIII